MTLEHFGSIGRLKILSDLLGIHVTASSLPLGWDVATET